MKTQQLLFELNFGDLAGDTAADATWGRLRVRLGAKLLWDVEWTWIELLEHLAGQWPYLAWEEQPPRSIGEGWLHPSNIAARYLSEPLTTDAAEEDFHAFCESHDLACALKGAWPPPLVLLRRGLQHHVWTRDAEGLVESACVLSELTRVGELIAGRLSGHSDPRAAAAIDAWRASRDPKPALVVAASTGFGEEFVVDLAGSEADVAAHWELTNGGPGELVAAARMLPGQVSSEDVRKLTEVLRRCQPRPTARLDTLVSRILGTLRRSSHPAEQGFHLAQHLRRELGNDEGPLDPEPLLLIWGVHLSKIEADPSIDAISCWGPSHGPAVILNTAGRHAQGVEGRRATLAHEICHLLADRADALPFAEVLGGRVVTEIEQRARAFAAELLLPEAAVRNRFGATNVRKLVEMLHEDYQVSREMIAWQIKKSRVELKPEESLFLRSLVSRPESW